MRAPHGLVLAAEFAAGNTGTGIAQGLRAQGWDVEGVSYADNAVGGSTVPMKILSRLSTPFARAAYEAALLRAVEETQPAVFLTVKGQFLSADFLAGLRRRGIVTANYYPDYHFDYAAVAQDSFPHYDLFLTTKSFQVDWLNRAVGPGRVHLVHHGYIPAVHHPRLDPIGEAGMTADIAYIGNHSAYKERWMLAVAKAFPRARIAIIGTRWAAATRGTALEPFVTGHAPHGDFYARAIQTSRINVAFHMGPHTNGWQDLVSTRTFEIPACRGFMLHIDNDEVRRLFAAGEEIGIFAGEDALCAGIEHYLQRPEERAAMIEKAYRRCVPAYSYDARAGEISRHLRALLAAHA